jgi:hypothetical protein
MLPDREVDEELLLERTCVSRQPRQQPGWVGALAPRPRQVEPRPPARKSLPADPNQLEERLTPAQPRAPRVGFAPMNSSKPFGSSAGSDLRDRDLQHSDTGQTVGFRGSFAV